jgi:hypothetical protein
MEKTRKKELKNEYQMKQKLSQEEWEEVVLENNSYYDIDMINKVKNDIKYWENYQATNWLGKWYRQIQIDINKKKLNTNGKK